MQDRRLSFTHWAQYTLNGHMLGVYEPGSLSYAKKQTKPTVITYGKSTQNASTSKNIALDRPTIYPRQHSQQSSLFKTPKKTAQEAPSTETSRIIQGLEKHSTFRQ